MKGPDLLAFMLTPLLFARTKKVGRPKAGKTRKNARPLTKAEKKAAGKSAKAATAKQPTGRIPPPPPAPPQPKPKIEVVLPFERPGKLVPPASAPQPVSPINGIRIAGVLPRFGWRFVALASLYQVTWGKEANLANSRSLIVNETAATLPPDHALAPGKLFYWRVRAGNDSGWGPWSPIQEFATSEENQEDE